MTTETTLREALAELVLIDDLKKSHAQASAHAAKFQTDDNYAVIDKLSTDIAKRQPKAWEAARAALALPQAGTQSDAPQVALPLEDAQMLLNWMEETFGNDGGVDWLDEDAAAVGDALYKALDNFKAAREAVTGAETSQAPSTDAHESVQAIYRALSRGHNREAQALARFYLHSKPAIQDAQPIREPGSGE